MVTYRACSTAQVVHGNRKQVSQVQRETRCDEQTPLNTYTHNHAHRYAYKYNTDIHICIQQVRLHKNAITVSLTHIPTHTNQIQHNTHVQRQTADF